MVDYLLKIKNISIGIEKDKHTITAVDNISFDIKEREIVGIVGESGCGKSLTALSIVGLLPENVSILSGEILFDDHNIAAMKKKEYQQIHRKNISIILQDSMTSLNPLIKIGKQIREKILLHKSIQKHEADAEVLDILKNVGIVEPGKCFYAYPHQLSGGMRQRVGIAMAIVCNPKLIIADEPTTALDVMTQSQILFLLKKVHEIYDTSILFISHDLGIIKQFCHRVIVMYAGTIVESGTINEVFADPLHEYTKGLINSIPSREQKGKRLICIDGRVPQLAERNQGCTFSSRCKKAVDICYTITAPVVFFNDNHSVSCHLKNKNEVAHGE